MLFLMHLVSVGCEYLYDSILKLIILFLSNIVTLFCLESDISLLLMSKYLMYDFHYNVMKEKYGDKCELIYTDTDSLVYEIKTDDLYSEMFEMKEYFDLSDVKIDKFKSNENKKVVGKFKDESNMMPITEFVALKPKLYSFLVHGE